MDPAAATFPKRPWLLPALFISLFAFLLASFPARNSDLWKHLAAGRLLAQATQSFGTSPGDLPGPALHSAWLYDVLSYALYSAVGGSGLVLFKALVVVGLALFVLRLSRIGAGWWIAAICTALALLALSIRVLLQPATVSYLFLALTLWFLWQHGFEDKETARQGDKEKGPRVSLPGGLQALLPPWPLMVLFVVWANMDSWFVLGLGTVALLCLGRVFDLARQGEASLLSLSPRLLFSLPLLGAACLLNPSFILHPSSFLLHLLPPELGTLALPGSTAVPRAWRLSPAGLAYFPLLGLGLLSFALNFRRWHWQRFLPWLGLALVSALQVRAVGFFAVLAGPVLAWNLQEFFARHTEAERRQGPLWGRALVALRALTVIMGLAFLVCAWPGWLQGRPFEPPRWAVDTPASLERGAAETKRWHEEGRLAPDALGLHLSPETAYAFAWFCPEEKGLVDDELAWIIRDPTEASDVRDERMRSAGINHVIVYDPDGGRLFVGLERLLADPERWPLLYHEGNLAVFGWRDRARAGGTEQFRGWEVDLNRLAFHPAKDKRAPREPPDWVPEQRDWWDAFWKSGPRRPIDGDEASLYLLHAEVLRRSAFIRHFAAWELTQSAALAGAAGSCTGPGGLLDAHLRLVLLQLPRPEPGSRVDIISPLAQLAREYYRRYTWQRDDTPPALLYLAVRAARRAVAVNPQDAHAYLVLGESYLRLLHDTRERAWGERMPELVQLRRVQASTALNQAISLNPDLAQAHLELGRLYRETAMFDLALQHLQAHSKLVHEAGPPPGVGAEQFRERGAEYDKELRWLAKEVEDREKEYEAGAARRRVLDRVALALEKSLPGKARDILLETDVSLFGSQGMVVELGLLLKTGRAKDFLEWTGAEQEALLGKTVYHRLRLHALAASGDYAQAQEECKNLALSDQGQAPRFRQGMAELIGQALFGQQPAAGSFPSLLWGVFLQTQLRIGVVRLASNMRQRADLSVLRGLLALEEGDVEEARVSFAVALTWWKDKASAASGAGLDFGGRVIAQDCLEWLK